MEMEYGVEILLQWRGLRRRVDGTLNGDWSWKIRVNRYGESPWSCFRALKIKLAVTVAVAVAVEFGGWHERGFVAME